MSSTAAQLEPQTDAPTEPAVIASGIVKRYGDLAAVAGIDFTVNRGTCLGVLGPNGAGKTTTIEMLEGLKQPDAGDITILGLAWNGDARAIQERIGVQLQETEFQEKLKVFELLELFHSFYENGADLEHVLDSIGLREKRSAFVRTLSGGQKQRLAVGCALLNKPEILFLDEPTTGLDPQARRRLWEVIEAFKANGGTIVITTHYMEEAERLADDLIIVDRGEIIARGSPASIIASLGAESVVQFSLPEGNGDAVPQQELETINGVNSVRYDADVITLSVTDTQSVISALFALLDSKGLTLRDLNTHRPTLEDVFVALTGKHLRDE